MAIKFTSNGMFGLKEGGLPDGVIDADVIANNTVTSQQLAPMAAGSVIGIHHFADATHNINMSAHFDGVIITATFDRKRTDTSLWAYGHTPIRGQYSYRCGTYLAIDNIRKYECTHYTSPPGNHGDDDVNGMMLFNGVWRPEELQGEITCKLEIGWKSMYTGSEKPGNFANPSQRSARDQDHTTQITFFELLDPCIRTTDSVDNIAFDT